MFFIGLSSNILPYLLVVLVSLVYYIEGETGKCLPVLSEKKTEIAPEKNHQALADFIVSISDIKNQNERVFHVIINAPQPEKSPFTDYRLMLIPNGPHRAPPC